MAVCKFCRKEITWIKEGHRNVPIESDGAVHDCEEKKKSMQSIRRIDPTTLSPEEISKYEKTINDRVSQHNKK